MTKYYVDYVSEEGWFAVIRLDGEKLDRQFIIQSAKILYNSYKKDRYKNFLKKKTIFYSVLYTEQQTLKAIFEDVS